MQVDRIHLTLSSKDKKFNKEHIRKGKLVTVGDYFVDIMVKTDEIRPDSVVIHNVRRKSFELGEAKKFLNRNFLVLTFMPLVLSFLEKDVLGVFHRS